jgi:hypothetical protein
MLYAKWAIDRLPLFGLVPSGILRRPCLWRRLKVKKRIGKEGSADLWDLPPTTPAPSKSQQSASVLDLQAHGLCRATWSAPDKIPPFQGNHWYFVAFCTHTLFYGQLPKGTTYLCSRHELNDGCRHPKPRLSLLQPYLAVQ